MKIYIQIIIICIVFCGCEDLGVLQEKPKLAAAETFMTDAEKVESVVFSCYNQLKRQQVFGRNMHTINETMADYSYGSGSFAFMSQYIGLDQTNIARINDAWAIFYRVVRFSNQILVEMQKAEMSDKENQELTGELRFLRALSYAFLVRNWGGVPLQNENNYKDLYAPKESEKNVYDFIVKDLQYAEQNLPDTPKKYGRPTKSSAKALLTEVYLYMEKWKEARDKALEIINSGQHALVPITNASDFYNIFGPTVNGTSEEIFYIKFNRTSGSEFAWMVHTTGTSYINSTQGAMGVYSLEGNQFIADWDLSDLRRPFCLYNATVGGIARKLCKKFIDPEQTGSFTSNDLPLYKYSDLLLYYAEAACRANNAPTPDAMEKLNMVHRRAYGKELLTSNPNIDFKLTDYNTLESFIDLVLKERGYETYCEGKRYYDLKRCKKLAEYVKYAKGIEITSEAAYWWPIPDMEFLYNPYLDVNKDQNPGY